MTLFLNDEDHSYFEYVHSCCLEMAGKEKIVKKIHDAMSYIYFFLISYYFYED